MRTQLKSAIEFVVAITIVLSAAVFTGAQTNLIPSRITRAIDPAVLTTLRGNTHPLAQPRFDRGAAPASLPMQRMLLVLKRSAQQEAALDNLLEEQQDASSPNYHRWLTPQQFGQQFGPSDQDIQTITSWLQSQGFEVNRVSNGRTVIEFSGTAGEVQSAFHTTIHQYQVNGQNHWANSSDPEIPTALTPVVAGIDSLYNFPRRPLYHLAANPSGRIAIGGARANGSLYTFPNPCSVTSQPFCSFAVGPFDFGTIYNVLPLWSQNPAIDGTGETIAIVGESDISVSDVEDFQKFFGMPVKDPTVIVDGPDPGIVAGDETESDLDVEWAGAIAKGASIDFVVSQTTDTSLGVDLSAQYIVDYNLAPVLSESYGVCELFLGNAGNSFYNQLWQQAAAEGITVVVAAGDSGSATCDGNVGSQGPAQLGLSVSGIASTPYDVAIGGTDFNDFSNPLVYWNGFNTTPSGFSGGVASVSAKGYIPEMTWNDTCTNQEIFSVFGDSSAAQLCNDSGATSRYPFLLYPIGGGGGKSSCTSSDGQTRSSCTAPYAKPAWQTALTPRDSARDVPDIAMFASNGFNGSFYVVCEADQRTVGNLISVGNGGFPSSSCNPSDPNTGILGIGGTSAPTPAFAGIIAMVDQAQGSRQGNANYVLYKLAAQSGKTCTSAANPASTCVFYDVPSGSTISMPCISGTPNCNTPSGDQYGVLYDGSNPAYNTAAGYDLATGLGSINASNLVNAWKSFSLNMKGSATTLSLTPPSGGSLSNLTHGQTVTFTTNVSAVAPATGTPTGSVALIANTGADGQQGIQTVTLNSSGDGSGSTNALPGGTYTVVANYAGDGTFGSSISPGTTVTVNAESSQTKLGIVTFDPSTGRTTSSNATSFPYGSPYLIRADVTNSSGNDCLNSGSGTPAYGCPTGSLTLTDNGAPLGPGTFSLNSQGYVEYQGIQLTGGSHNLAGNYAGDASYNTSSGTDDVTVTPAPTTTTMFNPGNVTIGQSFAIQVQTQATSSGVAPGGTFTVFDGSTPLSGSVSSNGFTNPSVGQVGLNGYITTTVSAPSGPHSLTAHYSGDQNYASSQSAAINVNAFYPASMSVTASPTSVVLGNSVTVTATLTTTNPGSNAALEPTGSITFNSGYGPLTGTVTTSVTTNSSGNWIEQATITTTPQQSEAIYASFNGDTNYLVNSAQVMVNVTIPDFSLSTPSPLTIVAGQTGTATVTIMPLTNYTSTVQLSCPTPPFWGASCSVSPSSVTLSNGKPATATLSVSTLAPSTSLTALVPSSRERRFAAVPSDRGFWWTIGGAAGICALFFLAGPRRRWSASMGVSFASVALLSFLVGCGGGASGSSGPGSGGGGSVSSSTTITASASKIAQNTPLTLSANVTSTGNFTGGVNFTSNCGLFQTVNLAGGSAQMQIAANTLAVGTCGYTAAYSGDFSHLPSTSGTVNIAVTGTVTAQLSGSTSTDFHSIQVSVALQ
jgi:hypothetical protein